MPRREAIGGQDFTNHWIGKPGTQIETRWAMDASSMLLLARHTRRIQYLELQ
jgi:hypothetical protein